MDIRPEEMMLLPSITVTGHEWRVGYTYLRDDGTRVFRGMVEIGKTDTTLGVLGTVYALEVLAMYGTEEYWPWLKRCLFRYSAEPFLGPKTHVLKDVAQGSSSMH